MEQSDSSYITRLLKVQCAGCSNFAEGGSRLSYSVTRDVATVASEAECEQLCLSAARFACKAFSYKFGVSTKDNCELSDRDLRDLQPRYDLEPGPELITEMRYYKVSWNPLKLSHNVFVGFSYKLPPQTATGTCGSGPATPATAATRPRPGLSGTAPCWRPG